MREYFEIDNRPLKIIDSGSNIQITQKNSVALLNRAILKDLVLRIETSDHINAIVSDKDNHDNDKLTPESNSVIDESLIECQMTMTQSNEKLTQDNAEISENNENRTIIDNTEESSVPDVSSSAQNSIELIASESSTKTIDDQQTSAYEPIPSDGVAMIIELRHLATAEDLQFLISLEEKTIIPKYLKNGFLSSSERAVICRLIVKNLLKTDPTKE